MDNALGPRDIQARIRGGQSLEEVSRVAGLPLDRVERFAAPVLAELEHVARVAMSSSVRRSGETSGHRILRLAVNERLQKRGVDPNAVDWNSFRQDDGRWSVSASYSSGEASRQALFVFDLQGRFSVAGNDEARWLLGEQSSVKGPQPGRRRPLAADGDEDADTEPTLDLSDELALVRVVQPPASPAPDQPEAAADNQDHEPTATVRGLYSVPDHAPEASPGKEDSDEENSDDADSQLSDEGTGSPLDTLANLMSAEEEAPTAGRGLSDATAVPETDNSGWEPGIIVDYPVEPGPESPGQPGAAVEPAAEERGLQHPAAAAEAGPEEDVTAPTPPRAPGKRKRAAVPSWDEIMFGGPPRSG